jgi:ParB family chromosome partitioning protein
MVPIEDIDPNPNQPRQSLGDITELVNSVTEKGILEPILVRPRGSRFQIIAGERRYRAATEAGLAEIPCVVRDTSDAEMMELALVENLQRKDLTPFEEADGLKVLADSFGYTHEAMAQKLGKSRSSITEILTLTAMPDAVREQCRRADIHSKSLLLQIVRQSTPEKMAQMVGRLQQEGGGREQARRIAKETKPKSSGRGRPRHFVFRYQPREKTFNLSLQFRKADVPREEVIRALEGIIEELRKKADRD